MAKEVLHGMIDRFDGEIRTYADEAARNIAFEDSDGWAAYSNWERVTVTLEKVRDALPTTAGSVIKSEGNFLVLNEAGWWGNSEYDFGSFDAESTEYEVVFVNA